MHVRALVILIFVTTAGAVNAQPRKAVFVGGGDPSRGKCTVEVFVDGAAQVEVRGDSATGFSYLEAKPVYNGESYVVAARYDDEYVRQNGHWKFKKMVLTPYFMVPLKEGWAQDDLLKMGH